MAPSKFRPAPPKVSELHRQWLQLVDCEGPFIALPVLKRVWPAGIPDFRTNHPERFVVLADARREFEAAWEALDRSPDDDQALARFGAIRDGWVETVLRDVVGWAESLQMGPVLGIEAKSPNRAVSVTAQAALAGAEGVGAIVHIIDPVDSMRETPNDLWAATPIDRVEAMLRESGVAIGIVTDGRWWGIVHAVQGTMCASGIVDALTWIEEGRARDAFFTLISRQQIVGGEPSDRLSALFAESVAAAEEITEALGAQVRQAVELLVESFSESAFEAERRSQPDPLPPRTREIYEAAVTVMMRIVFLLFAEERGLLPSGELFEHGYGVSAELDRLVSESAVGEEVLDISSLTWHRLLATSRALFQGASFENLRMPAYGGSLFDPTRFPFLTDTTDHGSLTISVNDRVMLHVLRSVQVANLKGEARRISFRDIDVEQIGYIYEGLLGYTCARVDEPVLGLLGKTGVEPEIPLAVLEQLSGQYPDPKDLSQAVINWVKDDQPSAQSPSVSALAKSFTAAADASAVSALAQAVGGDDDLKERITPWLGAVRTDLRGHPLVVRSGGLLVSETPSRRNAGAHYTPKSLAEEVVLHALQPLCYSPGPHQTADESTWKLRSSDEILALKVADIACGSGAFLVAAARYLSDRLVEAWVAEDPSNADRRDLHMKALRQVVANCLYGADINEMAVEMCKLSLWLVSLDRDLPFSFVDDKIFLGNSLLGLTSLDQLRKLHIDPSRVPADQKFDIFDVDIDSIIAKAVELRERLATEIDETDPARTSAAKQRQLKEFRRVTDDLRKIADGVIAAGLPLGGKPGTALDDAYGNLRIAVKQAFPGTVGEPDPVWLDGIIDRGLTPTVQTDYDRWQPLHWVLEVPDVIVDHGGFDAVIGNPPFLGGKKISTACGFDVESWLKCDLDGKRGAADLCSHFIRRAWRLCSRTGQVGVIGSDRIAQGDSSKMSLEILEAEGAIVRATSTFVWPGSASTYAAIVWATRDKFTNSERSLDGVIVGRISASLADGDEADLGAAVALEPPFQASLGVYLYGEGFVVGQEDPLISSLSPLERDHLRPFVNGESLLSQGPSDRLAICVNQFKAETELFRELPLLAAHLRESVKPFRDLVTSQVHDARYWAHWDKREQFFSALESLSHFIVCTKLSRVPIFIRTNDFHSLYSDAVILFATEKLAHQALLTSSVHFAWFEQMRTPRGLGSNYTVSRVLRTFPFPDGGTERAGYLISEFSKLRDIELEMLGSYSRVHNMIDDPTVTNVKFNAMRELLVEIDIESVKSYGWSDLRLVHEFHEFAGGTHFGLAATLRNEIRRRLLEENHRRAALESDPATPKKKSKRPKAATNGMEAMF